MAEYPKTARNTVNRYRGRGAYDYTTIHTIINTSPILHVSFNPSPTDPFPTTLPMIGALGSFPSHSSPSEPLDLNQPLSLYLHGYISSRLMRLPTTTTTSSSSSPTPTEDGLPLCITATHLDGLVLALTPNHHSMNYRSALLHGYASLVVSPEEKLYAMELVTNNLIPDRWDNTRVPPNKTEMQSTAILKVEIVDASAKVREGEPGEDRADERDEAVRGRVWTGVVPGRWVWGEPVKAGKCRVEVPEHVRRLVDGGKGEGGGRGEN